MKNIFLMIINVILISVFNVLFRYVNVLSDMSSFNNNSSVIGNYLTTSNVNTPYFKIFILSFLISVIFFTLIIFILKRCTNISFIEIVSRLNNFIVLIFIIVSSLLLYFNTTISFLVLITGFIIFIFFIYRNFECKKYIYVLCLLFILYFLIFYFISF